LSTLINRVIDEEEQITKLLTENVFHGLKESGNCSYVKATADHRGRAVARSNTGDMGLNPTRGMDVCVRLFCVCVLRVGSDLATG
jgi:hypothetical protein